ncbi:copper chaperone PCu(A)C [Bartonella ancashensis]|uniref:Copper metallochaperone, Cox17-like protein n=1 Tax=Bartonella ancashensis TaxID=1318743 RepID=A0A0M4L6L3_9HYPH|nr:copper chaperone PCu(A)C [Bartonella ancashensis]ALE03320.1 Copper metallochaperone, Cox17-like protein [Bartonella ancashensis]
MLTYAPHTKFASRNVIICAFYAFIFALIASPVNANKYNIGDIEIIRPWTRETLKNARTNSGYFHIINHGPTPDWLISIETDGVQTTEIHSLSANNDIVQMEKLTHGIEIPGYGETKLKRGGNHVMFMGLSQPFKRGDKIHARLVFEKAGVVDIDFTVADIMKEAPSSESHHHH